MADAAAASSSAADTEVAEVAPVVKRPNEEELICPKCDCLILRKNDGYDKEGDEREVPLPRQAKGEMNTQTETLNGWWAVDDMFAFENIGFCNAVDGIRWLTCAECEYGPIGTVDNGTKVHLIAKARVSTRPPTA